MTIRVLVNGAFGKMGRAAVTALADDPAFTVVAQCGRHDALAHKIEISQAHVVLDLTHPQAVLSNIHTIIAAGARPVIGTSGLIATQIEALQALCSKQKLGGIIVPNFSLGVVLMLKYAQEIVRYFPHVEIIEMHHPAKADSPSGTAIRTAEMLAARRNTPKEPLAASPVETVAGARGATYQAIPIHAIRLPGLTAQQQIIFGGTGETLTLRHDTLDRSCYMPGICLACKKVMALDHLVYGLEHIL